MFMIQLETVSGSHVSSFLFRGPSLPLPAHLFMGENGVWGCSLGTELAS